MFLGLGAIVLGVIGGVVSPNIFHIHKYFFPLPAPAGDDLLGAAPVPPGRGGRAAGHEEAPWQQQQQQPPAPAALPATARGQVRARNSSLRIPTILSLYFLNMYYCL